MPVGNDILIQVSFCPVFSSMSFKVREISLANPDFLLIPDLSTDSHDRMQDFASVPSLPYALSDYNIDEVKSECLKYIKSISKCPLHILEDLDENTSAIVWRSLEAVLRFLRANLEARQVGTYISPFMKKQKLISIIEWSLTQSYKAILDAICHGERSQSQRRICAHSYWEPSGLVAAFSFSVSNFCTSSFPADQNGNETNIQRIVTRCPRRVRRRIQIKY